MSIENRELFFERCKEYFKEYFDIFKKSLEQKPSSGFFINEKKADKDVIFNLIDFKYKETEFTDKSFYFDDVSIGKSKAYELGLIYPQDIESSIPASLINKDAKLAIDLCAAPGGKSINALNYLDDKALLISNEVSYKRATALYSNLERCGLSNVMITNLESSYFAKNFKSCFDLVMLDAPCSGEGMVRKYPEIIDDYNLNNIEKLASIQKELLEDAYKILKKGGQLLYSTCTYAFEEDEMQISAFLKRHPDMSLVILDDFDLNMSTLKGTLKFSPICQTEGQFIALMTKNDGDCLKPKYLKTADNKIVKKFINDNLNIENYYLYKNESRYYLSFIELLNIENHILSQGIYLGELIKDRFEPSHSLYRSNQLIGKFKNSYDLNDEEYNKYICGLELDIAGSNNYYLINYKGISLGYGKLSNGKLKNKYPKGLRRMV